MHSANGCSGRFKPRQQAARLVKALMDDVRHFRLSFVSVPVLSNTTVSTLKAPQAAPFDQSAVFGALPHRP